MNRQKLQAQDVIRQFDTMISGDVKNSRAKFLFFQNGVRPLKCSAVITKLLYKTCSPIEIQNGIAKRNWVIVFARTKISRGYVRSIALPLKNIRFFENNFPYIDYLKQNLVLSAFFSNHFVNTKLNPNTIEKEVDADLTKFSFMN